ncbi:tetratricopeptide repeat protein [Shewanella oncorhynchi]|uniref:tetratricopeptide repeat protein n=1 Tax=Shewanella oncorhynchi TaxID=2726434 RepID=UPI003D7922C3
MVKQEHSGPGDNVAGNKYDYIIRSIQARDLMSVTASIMRDVCYRDLDKALEKLNVLCGISALEADVQLLLKVLKVKAALINPPDLPSKNDLLTLLKYDALPEDVREVVSSILIDLESRTSERLARERYSDLQIRGVYTKEVFYERLAHKEELNDSYRSSKVYDLSEQELTGLVRGAIRVEDFVLAFELAQRLHEYYLTSNSTILLLYAEACLLCTQSQHSHYISLSKQEKRDVDRLVTQLLTSIADKDDSRHIAILIHLLNLTDYLDRRLFDLGKLHIDKIRQMSPECAEYIEHRSEWVSSPTNKFELISDSLNLEQFARLDLALQNEQIKVNAVNTWIDRGGAVRTGDDYVNSLCDLYLRASLCSDNNKKDIQLLDKKAQCFFELDYEKFIQINPRGVLRLCEKFNALGLPLNTVKYLTPFLPDEPWVSPIFECYLTALCASEKFDLFLSKIKHLEPDDKTASICLSEAQVYERLNEYELSIASIRAAIKISPNHPYSWHQLLHLSRESGLSNKELSDIVFEMPEVIFSSYDDSKVPLVNEIACFVDINLADRILVDWFAQNPVKVATALTQIHFNSLGNRPEVTNNPYELLHCCDGVTYTDGFETFTRLLVRDVDSTHPLLLDIESPLGQTLNGMQEGTTSGVYTMLERLPSYVAAFRHAVDMRHKGNDGTDAFRMFSVPTDEEEFIPYFESILKSYSSQEKRISETLQNPKIPLTMRSHYTDKGSPVQGAIKHLSSCESTQYMGLFNGGEEQPDKLIIDVYTAVYLSLIGFASCIVDLNLKLVLCQHTKRVLESWVEDVLREDYMSMGVSEQGLYRITSEDIQRNSLDLIHGLKTLLKYANVEALKSTDTPELLVKIRDLVDETVYSTFQLSVANDIPLLCIDHLMMELVHHSGWPVANMKYFIIRALNSLSLKERKKSIQLNLYLGTPVSVLYQDIIELSCSPDITDTHLVFKFIEKYGETIDATGYSLNFLTDIVRNVTAVACRDGIILDGGRAVNPRYDGYAEYVFYSCSRLAMKVLVGDTAEQRLARLISAVIDTPSLVPKHTQLISRLASEFVFGHFLDFKACNEAFVTYKNKTKE